MFAKEKRGANIEIYKTDQVIKLKMEGTPWERHNIEPDIRGELIAVKENSLLLMERESGADVIVDIAEVGVITIAKKSQLLLGAGLGTLIGTGVGAVIGASMHEYGDWGPPDELKETLPVGALLGLLMGTITGLNAGTTKTFQIEGRSDAEIQEILEYLRKKARVRNSQ